MPGTRSQSPAPQTDGGNGTAATHRAMWAMGNYDRFARATVWELGPVLLRACGVASDQRVLDVAAGTGNVAIRAALEGASVVASDLTPQHFIAGRRGAAKAGVTLEWIEGDAEALPFDDGSFDVVTSCLGAVFAPHHERVADEFVRVCRPNGTIGLITFTPEGIGGEFFALLAPYLPSPPPGAEPPLLWGREAHVHALFDNRVSSLVMTRHTYVERAPSPEEYARLFMDDFGPVIAIRANLDGAPERLAAFDRAFTNAIARWNRGRDGPVEVAYEYLLVVARKS